ncbi:DNA repair protein rhp26 [Mycoemilia scoparia]|uniref:DNA repair protein rhp26 n=1 Tax=Mycoemilia scoparia TaxID=417184 RepID=A0A9W7ZWL9_9FUNG|nr:DNA repair protein rhp26 [Mycoemilia scoparia]
MSAPKRKTSLSPNHNIGSSDQDDTNHLASSLGIKIQDQTDFERNIREKVNQDITDEIIKKEQQRHEKVTKSISDQHKLLEKAVYRSYNVPSGSAAHDRILKKIEDIEDKIKNLENDREEIKSRLVQAQTQAQGVAVITKNTFSTKIVEKPVEPQNKISSSSTANTTVKVEKDLKPPPPSWGVEAPKQRSAAIKAEKALKYHKNDDSEDSGDNAIQINDSDDEYMIADIDENINIKRERDDDDEQDDEDYNEETGSNELLEIDDDGVTIYTKPQAEKSARQRQIEANERYNDDGDEISYQKRLRAWAIDRWRLRNPELDVDDDSIPQSELDQEPYLSNPLQPDTVLSSSSSSSYNTGKPNLRGRPALKVPYELWDPLFGYQRDAIKWLFTLYEQNVGGILGDEMGLGKTVQLVAFVGSLYHSKLLDKPSIVVCPATLMRQWVMEFHRWWPALRVSILHHTGSGMLKLDGVGNGSNSIGSDDEEMDIDRMFEIFNKDVVESGSEEGGFSLKTDKYKNSSDEYEHDQFGWRTRKKRKINGGGSGRGRRKSKGNATNTGGKPRITKAMKEKFINSIRKGHDLAKRVFKDGHVLVTTYAGLQTYRSLILKHELGVAILDEGHTIRNPDSEATLTCKQLKTYHRIILSGTPIQNNLTELWSLFDFVYPGRLGTLPVFNSQFSVPIKVGGYASASNFQVRTAYECACMLRDLINPYLLRRLKVDVAKELPGKREQVLFCKLTEKQRQDYLNFLDSSQMVKILEGKLKMLVGVDKLRKICNHPDINLLFHGHQQDQPKIDDEAYFYSNYTNNHGHGKVGEEEDFEEDFDYDDDGDGGGNDDYSKDVSMKVRVGDWRKSGKMKVVHSLLKMWKKQPQGNKVLLFTQTRQMLEILQNMAEKCQFNYLRMDGTTPVKRRAVLVDQFNENPDIFLFLLTTKVGGLGVNLTGANRVVIFDPDWNPSTDMQARERAWRLGQKRDVVIYRLLTAGTIEEKIYHRQIYKQFLSDKILNDPNQGRFFHGQTLRDLFTLGDVDDETGGTETGNMFSNAKIVPRSHDYSDEDEEGEITNKASSSSVNRRIRNKNGQTGINYGLNDVSEGEKDEDDESIVKISSIKAIEDYKPPLSSPEESSSVSDNDNDISSDIFGGNISRQRTNANVSQATTRSTKKRRSGKDSAKDKNQEDRVLNNLFEMAGIHGALEHDAVIGYGNSAHQKIIREQAQKVVLNAIAQLEESRGSDVDISQPTWTGASGVAGDPKKQQQSRSRQRANPNLKAPRITEKSIKNMYIPPEVQFGEMVALGSGKKKDNNSKPMLSPSAPTPSKISSPLITTETAPKQPSSAMLLANLRKRSQGTGTLTSPTSTISAQPKASPAGNNSLNITTTNSNPNHFTTKQGGNSPHHSINPQNNNKVYESSLLNIKQERYLDHRYQHQLPKRMHIGGTEGVNTKNLVVDDKHLVTSGQIKSIDNNNKNPAVSINKLGGAVSSSSDLSESDKKEIEEMIVEYLNRQAYHSDQLKNISNHVKTKFSKIDQEAIKTIISKIADRYSLATILSKYKDKPNNQNACHIQMKELTKLPPYVALWRLKSPKL